MNYDEERTVTKNPNGEQKEVIKTETNYVPTEPHYVPVVQEHRGFSGASVALMVIAAVSVIALLFALFMNQRAEDENTNKEVVIRQEPAQQQPVVVQQPPVVVQQPASQPPVVSEPSASSSTSSVERDLNIQTEIEKRLDNDETFKAYDITTTVTDGKVTLIGTVDSEEIKMKIERMVNQVKGVKQVDNKLIVSSM